jgi:hypothetical protein
VWQSESEVKRQDHGERGRGNIRPVMLSMTGRACNRYSTQNSLYFGSPKFCIFQILPHDSTH